MEVIVKKNYEEMSKAAATLFAAEIMENPKTILGMATGSTPVGLYKELVKMYEAEILISLRLLHSTWMSISGWHRSMIRAIIIS